MTPNRRANLRSLALALAVAATTAVMTANPAGAAPIAVGSEAVDESGYSGTCEAPDGTSYDLYYHLVGTHAFHDTFHGPLATFDYQDPWFGAGAEDLDFTYTNATTGLSWTSHLATRYRDVRLLSVEGNLQRALTSTIQHFRVFAPDGTLAGQQDTRAEWIMEFDTKGTADPDDDTAQFIELTKDVGHRTTRDFCVDANAFTLG